MTDEQLMLLRGQHKCAGRLTRLLNNTPETDPGRQKALEAELFGVFGEGAYAKPPVYCSFGCHTRIGAGFFSNYGCIFLDRSGITIGDHVMLGPSVTLLADDAPIAIRDHVWIGGNTVLCGGVTVGSGTVIGAGSVVREDIPPNVVAAGNPCRVIRPVTGTDAALWQQKLDEYHTLCDDPMV